MKILLNKIDLNEALFDMSDLGFVPTMGSLHQGHISLIKNLIRQKTRLVFILRFLIQKTQ